MKLIVEPSMHIDSRLSANIQFADWVAACVTRAIDYQLIDTSRFRWITDATALRALRGAFTHESKLHFWQRSLEDLHHSQIFYGTRPVHPSPAGQLLGAGHAEQLRRMKAAAERAHDRTGAGSVAR